MFRNLTIARKGLLVLLLPLLYQALLLGVLLRRQREQIAAQEWVVHTKDVLAVIDQVQLSMQTLQGALRGYAITGLSDFETEAATALRELPEEISALRLLTISSEEQRQHVAALEKLVDARVAWHHEVMGIVKSGDHPAAMQRMRQLQGKRLMDALHDQVERLRATTERLDQIRLDELRRSTSFQNKLLVGGLAMNVAVGLGAAVFVSHNYTRRIDVLTENARRFARGEKLLPQGHGHDEIADLDRTFHEMALGLSEGQRRERAFQAVLERRNAELERANRDLDHKNDENEMFVYSVSHDLRSPLVNLQGFSKELGLVRDDLRVLFSGNLDEAARTRALKLIERDVSESIHYIQTAVVRLSGIIDALLRLSRAGRVEYRPEMIELGPVIERIRTALRGSVVEKGAEIMVGQLPPVWGDPGAIEQVFANLLTNAVNYLDPARPGRIEVGVCETPPDLAAGQPTYYVKDNGLGIPDAYLPKVFAIFQRLHDRSATGEGVGLTLVRRMVERHGGSIWVESKEGVGSTFFVALPERERSPLTVAPRKESIRVLLPNPAS
jgi:signal transduction histidine kinase